jgi:hypothetical protein
MPVKSQGNHPDRQPNQNGDTQYHEGEKQFAHHLSRRTPLNFLAAFFFAVGFFADMNSPDVLLRLVRRA